MEELYNKKCEATYRACKNCSYNSCSNTLPELACNAMFARDEACECPEEGI